MGRYVKRPVEIEAIRFEGVAETCDGIGVMRFDVPCGLPQWLADAIKAPKGAPGAVWLHDGTLYIGTLEGLHRASAGDMIIQGVAGEIYPCKPGIFDQTYERASESA